ncbi:transglutaminase-like domain-containing protein [Thermogladius sp. KZ2Tp1]|uniref:transglutaminase-like domain-containing protein n=1 Tax=Thermogladius sp. KZ2Tp1 TaxID=3136289 RepID=UPI003DA85C47
MVKWATVLVILALLVSLLYTSLALYSEKSEVDRLTRENESYSALLSSLNKTLAEVSAEYSSLQLRYRELEGRYNATYAEYQQVVAWLQGNASYYKQLLAEYEREVELLNRSLVNNITYYESLVSALRGNLSHYVELAGNLSAELEIVRSWLAGNQSFFLDQLLLVSDELHSLRAAVSQPLGVPTLISSNTSYVNSFITLNVKLAGSLDLALPRDNLIDALVNYTLVNFYYQYDPVVLRDYWKPVNETLIDRGGDCDDLALFVFSYLYSRGYNYTYLVAFESRGYGHVAVVTYAGGAWYLIDLAGDWFNGYSWFLRIDLARVASTYTVRVPPLSVHPDVKAWLLSNGFASLVKVRSNYAPSSGDIASIMRSWSSYWASLGYPQYRFYLVGYSVYYTSSDVGDVAGYLSSLVSGGG